MKRSFKLSGLMCVLVAGPPVTSLFAHGGRYPGPSDTIPPNTGGNGDTTPPGNPGGPTSPTSPTGPATGGKGPVTGGRGGGPGQPGIGPRGGGGGVTRRANGSAEGFERWEFWWENNDDQFLDLHERLRGSKIATQGLEFLRGRGRTVNVDIERVGTAEIKARVVPALLAALDAEQADIVDSAVLALARVTRAEDAASILPAIVKTLGHREQTPRESATLALGVLGSADAIPVLRALLNDTPDGRRLTRQPNGVEEMVRAFAAASLGLIGSTEAIADLKALVNDERLNAKTNLKSVAVSALGLVKGDPESVVTFLQDVIGNRALDVLVRAQAPIALARIAATKEGSAAARATLGNLVDGFLDDKSDNQLLRSLAIALGRVARLDDDAAVNALVNTVNKAKDDSVRNFSLMALAEIGAHDDAAPQNAKAHGRLTAFFHEQLTQKKRLTLHPWAALALGVYARNPGLAEAVRTDARRDLLEAFLDAMNPDHKGAMAVALGLLSAKEATEELAKCFEDTKVQSLQGYTAVALGLLFARQEAEEIRTLLKEKGLDARLKLQLARGLGLMADTEAVADLVAALKQADTLGETASTAESLGLIGDRTAVTPLIAILGDPTQTAMARGFAAVGLGLLAEKSELPWNVPFAQDSNYRAKTPALAEILDIL